jgi:hypothetical protein
MNFVRSEIPKRCHEELRIEGEGDLRPFVINGEGLAGFTDLR